MPSLSSCVPRLLGSAAMLGCLSFCAPAWLRAADVPKRSLGTRDAEAAAGLKLFREQIRPILAGKCLHCHGPDRKKGGLDLSRRARLVAGGDSGEAVLPGKPGESLLHEKVAGGKMPPANPLSAQQIAAFRAWIEAGAPYEDEPVLAVAGADWWAFQPVRRPAVPRTRFDALARNAVDHFLFAALEKKGLQPAPPADRLALLRRVTFDLTGLPPTPDEVSAFLADNAPDAYQKVVDRLLASPAYGERWARHWLDVVRFGESNGYEQNHLRQSAWPYRDYVIRALNEDRPYAQFIIEQLAGDVAGPGDGSAEAATGFLVAGVHDTVGIQTEEGTRQQRANDLDDMASTIGAAFLGLSLNCARCHDHKFDPIPQKDYYRLTAVLAGVQHGERPLGPRTLSAQQRQERDEVQRRARQVARQLADLDEAGRGAVLRAHGVYPVPRPAVNARRNVEDFTPVRARFVRMTILATRDGSQPCLDELEVYGPEAEVNLALASRGAKATASSLLPGYPIHQIHHVNDGKPGNDWSWISNEPGRGWVQIELPAAQRVSRVVWSRDAAGDRPRYTDRVPSRYRIEVSGDGRQWQAVASGDDRAAAEDVSPGERVRALTPDQRQERSRLLAEAKDLAARSAALDTPGAPVYAGTFTAPHPVYLLKRGDVMQRLEEVTPGALSRLPGLSGELTIDPGQGEAGRRLALARWICDPKNPLTPRVLVNRLWQHHFGQGIVNTPSDFGRNGARPTHPELLDYLADDFLAGGGRLKRLHRLLVTSYAYRQSSAVSAAGLAADAGNHLLGRMPLRRLEAETVRDAILATSGKLDRRRGGPGFALFKYRVINIALYEPLDEQGPDTWRRAVYQQSARAIREEMLASLDSPECSQRMPRRDVTTTPLQALSLLNGSFLNQQAEFFAERVRREAGDGVEAQVEQAFRLAFGRPPRDGELKAAQELVARRGLAALGRVFFNANEFLYY
jgi:mono/diheme cytochrome c family protein